MSTVEATQGTGLRTVEHMSVMTDLRVLAAAARHPVGAGRYVSEVVTFLFRDVACAKSSHDPVQTGRGPRCRRCWREPYIDSRGRSRWRDPVR